MRPRPLSRYSRFLASAIIPVLITIGLPADYIYSQSEWDIESPYVSVDWERDGQYKANFHTHTTVGGAGSEPQTVIDRYRELGYGILALTDHDDNSLAEPTWPWEEYGRESKALNMVAIQGNEISEVHHIGSLFSDYGDPDAQSEEEALEEIGRRGGVALFHHPGRYEKGVEWYVEMYRCYDHLIGQEVYNRNDRYPGDRKSWDAILSKLYPERPVWGFASDDMHNLEKDIGISWNVVIVPELTSDMVREALEQGRFFFVNDPTGPVGAPAPVIESITADEAAGSIRIEASGHEYVEWLSEGAVIHRGELLNLAEVPEAGTYVRAEVHGPDGIIIGTQPIQIQHQARQE
ncbi:MAG: hypothetical protein JSW54_07970 [Fidelibacterota bacterium]|nr:MAG: hypothetical protein JSW54_07970 [Candidatus Neomarinimicrobiota bacterium]